MNKFTPEELKQFPQWLRDIMRTTPEYPRATKKGEEFDPMRLPVFQGEHGRYYDPHYSAKEDSMLLARKGTAKVPGFARGDEDLNFMTVGQGNIPPERWYDATHHRGVELPDWAASMSPQWAREHGYVIDPHGWDPRSWFQDPLGRWNYAGDASSGGGRRALEFRWPGGSKGLEGTRGRITSLAQYRAAHPERPENYGGGPAYDVNRFSPSLGPGPTPYPSPVVGQGQVFAGGSNIGYAPGTYTGEIGGPGDPRNAGRDFGGREPMYGGFGTYPGSGNPISGGTQIETDWVNYPGLGMVPRAVSLGGPQASTNLWDYMNPFGGTSRGGSGTGAPTQRAIGTAVGTATNLIVPGLGFVTGPIARYVTSLFQQNPNTTPQQVKAAVEEQQKQGKLPPMPSGSVPLPTTPPPTQASRGFSPTGQTPRGREWWSGDFGRGLPSGEAGAGAGDYNLAGPGGGFGQKGTGFGSGTVGNFATAIGFGGNLGGGIGAGNLGSLWGGRAAPRRPTSAAQWGNSPMGSGQAGGQLASFIAANTRGSGPVPTYNSYANAWANAPNLAALLPQFSGEVNRGTPLRRTE